ncbi:MAG TPA: response regulator [Blastocatellia bacterium]|nr:response regulator [Blastocatellia bacterium]
MDQNVTHILLVEDDEDTRFVYSVLLQMEGYMVTHVGTMANALTRSLSTSYDLIIMDIRLPDGDGVALCEHIRSFNRVTPIMFVSAAAFEKDVERGLKAGAQAYMTKPADADELLKNIGYLLGKKGASPADRKPAILPGLVSDAAVAAALIDGSRRYKAVSPAYAEAGGYDAIELVGKSVTDIFPDVSGEAAQKIDEVARSGHPYFISRYPYLPPHQPEKGMTYWDAAVWPVESSDSEIDVLIVVRQKEQSGDIAPQVTVQL